MKRLVSDSVRTFSFETGPVKLGHPVPESNFASESKSGVPQQTHLYVPGCLLSLYSPVKARSVPFFLATRYCSGVSSFRQSSSLFFTLSVTLPLALFQSNVL